MANDRRDLPNFHAYAVKRAAVDPITRGIWKSGVGCVAMLAGVAAAGWAAFEVMSIWFAIPAIIFSIPLMAGIVTIFDSLMRQPRNDEERHRVELHGLTKAIAGMGRKRVQKDVDPIAGQILEACALQRQRILSALNSPLWTSRGATGSWKNVREESLNAAEAAMEEALILASPYIGPGKGRDGEDEWSKVVSDFLDKGVGEALRRVDRLLSKRPPLDPATIPSGLRPAFAVATQMQALADEVESAAESAMSVPSAAGSSLDQALQNLRAVQAAEQELDAGNQVQQRLQ